MTPQDINANYIADLYGETYLAEVDPAPRKRLAISALFPGFVVVAIASAAATWFSEHYGMPVILSRIAYWPCAQFCVGRAKGASWPRFLRHVLLALGDRACWVRRSPRCRSAA